MFLRHVYRMWNLFPVQGGMARGKLSIHTSRHWSAYQNQPWNYESLVLGRASDFAGIPLQPLLRT